MKKEKTNVILIAFILAAVPVVWTLIMLILDGKTLSDVSLLNSQWNDELVYFKLTESVTKFGYPRGFFGFDESHARILSFAAWSPVIILQWVIWGVIFGWNLMSPYICNIVFLAISMLIFGLLSKPSWKQCAAIALLFGAYRPIARFTLSCIPESELFGLLIVFLGLCISVIKDKDCTKKFPTGRIVLMFVYVALMTWMRPYLILFMVMPFLFFVHCSKKKHRLLLAFFVTSGVGILTAAVYLLISKYLGAPYWVDLFYTDWIKAFATEGFGGGISYTVAKFKTSCYIVLDLIKANVTKTGFHASGLYYMIFLAILFFMFVHFIVRLVRWISKKDREKGWFLVLEGQILFSMAAFFIADMLMYRIQEGGRHTFVYMVGCIVLLPFVLDTGKKTGAFYIGNGCLAAAVFAVFVLWGDVPYEYDVPYYDDVTVGEYEKLSSQLEKNMVLDTSSNKPSFDNTVIWNYETDYTAYYAVPAGFGINLCHEEYVLDNFDSLQSRYLGIKPGSALERVCLDAGAELIGENESIMIYKIN